MSFFVLSVVSFFSFFPFHLSFLFSFLFFFLFFFLRAQFDGAEEGQRLTGISRKTTRNSKNSLEVGLVNTWSSDKMLQPEVGSFYLVRYVDIGSRVGGLPFPDTGQVDHIHLLWGHMKHSVTWV